MRVEAMTGHDHQAARTRRNHPRREAIEAVYKVHRVRGEHCENDSEYATLGVVQNQEFAAWQRDMHQRNTPHCEQASGRHLREEFV